MNRVDTSAKVSDDVLDLLTRETSFPPKARRGHDDRINLSSNELIHPDIPVLLDETGPTMSGLLRSYPVMEDVHQAVADYLAVEPQQLALSPGSDSAIRMIVQALAVAQKPRVILQTPNYNAWEEVADLVGAELLEASSISAEDSFALLRAAAKNETGCLIGLSWPNGPVGYMYSLTQLRELQAIANSQGHLLVIDACYLSFSDLPLRTAAQLVGPRTVLFCSFSKSHGLAGARIAAVVAERELLESLRLWRYENQISSPALAALGSAIRQQPKFEAIWDDLSATRDSMARRLADLGLRPLPSQGNFVNFFCHNEEFAAELVSELSRRGIRVRNTSEIPGLEGYVRMTVADQKTVDEAFSVLTDSLGQLESEER